MPIVQHRRGTLAALAAANETPSAGEIYLETDTNRLKVGDGTTAYNALPYVVGSGATGGSSALNKSLSALTFNGSTTAFALAIGGVSVSPATAQSLIIVLNGVIQIPDVAYTVSGSTITFSVAPAATDVFSGVYLTGGGAVFASATITSAATDNYQLPIGATHVLLTSTASKTFSSFVSEVGGQKWIYNTSTSGAIITLTHAATTGVATNRFATETGAAIIIQPNHSVLLSYDSTVSLWRVSRAIVSVAEAWWTAHADKTKLTGIATAATANATDAQLRDRSTHTGAQAMSTVTDLDSTVSGLNASIATKQASGSYAASVHTHVIADVTALQAALDAKQVSGSYAASSHTHAIANVTGLQTAIDGKQATGSYAASSHAHAIADVTSLQDTLDGKQATGAYATLVAGKVPSNQLPSYVDDVLEYDTFAQLPASGEESKIYLVISTSRIYRWAGSVYVLVEASPGSTDSVVEGATNLYFTGARAVTALQASLALKANLASPTFTGTVSGITAAMVGLGACDNVADTAKPVSTAQATAIALKANSSHTHGNITNVGAIGSTTGLPIITTASGVLTTGAFGYSSGQFAQGNDYRIIDGSQIASTGSYGRVRLAETLAGRTTTNTSDAVTPASVYYSSRAAGRAKFWECYNDFVFDYSGGITSDGFNLHMLTSSGTAALYLSRFSTQPFGLTCTTTSGGSTVTTSTTARLRAGMLLAGSSIPANCTITSVVDGTSFYMSGSATSTATGATLTFTQPGVGLLELTTSSSSTGYAMVYSYQSEMPRMDDGTRLYECMVQVPLLSDATQEFLCRIGMHDGSTSMSNGIYFEYNRSLNGNFWTFCSTYNSTTTRVVSSVPVVAGAWVKLSFRSTVSGSTITLYPSYNGTEVGSITTNIRADGAMKLAASIIKSVGTTSRSFLVDYVYMRHEWIGSR